MAGKKKNSALSVSLLDILGDCVAEANKEANESVELTEWGFPVNTTDEIEMAVQALMDILLTSNIGADAVEKMAIRAIAPKKDESPESLAERRREFIDPFKAKMRTAAKHNGKRKLSMAKAIPGKAGKFIVLGPENSYKERTKDESNGRPE